MTMKADSKLLLDNEPLHGLLRIPAAQSHGQTVAELQTQGSCSDPPLPPPVLPPPPRAHVCAGKEKHCGQRLY